MDNFRKNNPVAASIGALLDSPLFRNICISGALILSGIVIGYLILGLSSARALVVGICGAFMLLSIKKIEVPFFLTLFLVIMLQEAEVTEGTVFSLLENYKFEGIPTILELSLAILAVSFIARYFLQREDWSVPIFNPPLIIFFVLFFISLMVGKGDNNDFDLIKVDFKRFLLPALFFMCCLNILNSRDKIIHVAFFTTAVVTVKAYLGVFYYLKGMGFPYGADRLVFLESADHLMLATIFTVMISYMIFSKINIKMIFFLFLGIPPMIFALIFSYRRHAWLGILLSLILLFFLSPVSLKVRWFVLSLCGVLAVISLISLSDIAGKLPSEEYLQRRFSSISDSGESSNVAHIREWEVAFDATIKHPFLGLGLGSEHPPVPGFESLKQHTVHNAFMMLWMKMGIFAVIFLLWGLVRYLKLGLNVMRSREDFDLRPLFVGLFSTFPYWIVTLNVGPTWFYYRETCLMALVIAIVYQLSRLKEADEAQAESA